MEYPFVRRVSVAAVTLAILTTAAARITRSDPSQGASYVLDRIEVTRKYRPWNPAENPGTTMSPGTQTVSASTRMFQLGWEIAFKSGTALGRSHGLAQVDLTEVPRSVEVGQSVTFKAVMRGWWETLKYGIQRDHTISISGAVGNQTWSTVGDPNGKMEGSLDTTNTVVVTPGGDEITLAIGARINFGDDNWGDMAISLIYKCQNCEKAQLTARLICRDPLTLTPSSSTSLDQQVCTVCIGGWMRNVSDPVQVVFPEQVDSYGRHANGVTVFAGGSDQTAIGPMGVEPSRMGGYRCPDRQTSLPVEYPWNILLKAELNAGAGPFSVRITVRQKGAGSVMLRLTGTVGAGGRAGAGGTMSASLSLQTSDGHYVAAVSGGGRRGPEAMHTDAARVGEHERFEFLLLGGDDYAIRTASGNFLTAVNGGGVAGAESIHTDANGVSNFERFKLVDLGGGFYALRTSNGHYLTAVGGGGRTADAIHTDATGVGAFERFKLVR